MKTIRIVTFLLFYVIITFLWLLYDRRNIFDENTVSDIMLLPAIWVFPISMILIGLILSSLYSFFKKTKKSYFIFGQLSCIVMTLLLFIYTFISDRQHETKYGNFEFNRANRVNTFFPRDTAYQAKAYDALEKNFSDKNSFRLVELVSYNQDSNMNSLISEIHVSLFKYYLEKNPNKFLYAKYNVINDTATQVYIDTVINSSDFRQPSAWVDSLLRKSTE